jgi:hypothetical protein
MGDALKASATEQGGHYSPCSGGRAKQRGGYELKERESAFFITLTLALSHPGEGIFARKD